MASYIIHSAKGQDWKNHKYYRKVNGIYFYTQKEYENYLKASSKATPTTTKTSSTKSNTSSSKVSTVPTSSSSSKKKSSSKKTTTSKKGGVKISKPSGKSSNKSANKTEKTAKQATEKVAKTTKQPTEKVVKDKTVKEEKVIKPIPRVGIMNALNKVANIGDNDSVYSKSNEDGSWTVIVDFEDGNSQTFVINGDDFSIMSKSDKKKNEEDEIKHSQIVYYKPILNNTVIRNSINKNKRSLICH